MIYNKAKIHFMLLFILSILPARVCVGSDSIIRFNSLGFLPDMPKRVSIISECEVFHVKDAVTDVTVYSGTVRGPVHQEDVGQDIWQADFSDFMETGEYYLEFERVGKSIKFRIADDVYNQAYYTAMRGFYLWRCGTAVEGKHNGEIFSHKLCHLTDGRLDYIGGVGTRRDGAGGWHDAGDYGKYTVNAGVTMGVLFLAWEQYQSVLKGISLDIPDTAKGYPDYLKELKWETDWLLKMQYPDGSGRVSHKLTRLGFSGFVMPEEDKEKRYFTDWSTAATADFVAVMATAARIFKPYDEEYSKICLKAAIESYACLKMYPENRPANLKGFSTGGYGTRDNDDRLWAAAAIWETTGSSEYQSDFEDAARQSRRKIEAVWDWGNVGNLGMITYLFSKRPDRDPELLEVLHRSLIYTADLIVETAEKDVYNRPLGGRYYWGCNGTVARQTVILMAAYQFEQDIKYKNASLAVVDHLFGRNYYGRSFVTGIGHNPPMNPHDRRSGADSIINPWPGYLTGGGHTATDWQDIQDDYRTNEIAINWQAALVYSLAAAIS